MMSTNKLNEMFDELLLGFGETFTSKLDAIVEEMLQLKEYISKNFPNWVSAQDRSDGFLGVNFIHTTNGHEIWIQVVPKFDPTGSKELYINYVHIVPGQEPVDIDNPVYHESFISSMVISTIVLIESPYIDRGLFPNKLRDHTKEDPCEGCNDECEGCVHDVDDPCLDCPHDDYGDCQEDECEHAEARNNKRKQESKPLNTTKLNFLSLD